MYNAKIYVLAYVRKSMSVKQGVHKWYRLESINVVAKSIIHMYITAELKAYWFL